MARVAIEKFDSVGNLQHFLPRIGTSFYRCTCFFFVFGGMHSFISWFCVSSCKPRCMHAMRGSQCHPPRESSRSLVEELVQAVEKHCERRCALKMSEKSSIPAAHLVREMNIRSSRAREMNMQEPTRTTSPIHYASSNFVCRKAKVTFSHIRSTLYFEVEHSRRRSSRKS